MRAGSALADRSLADVELPMDVGMRVVALRRGREWLFDPDGDDLMLPDDVLILRGARGHRRSRELAGAPEWRPAAVEEDPAITDLDRAVDVLVDMKNVSEAAVGLAYSALLLRDAGLAAQVSQLEDRLDEMREQLELWVLRAAAETVDPSGLRGLLHLGAASEEVGDAAQQLVWLVEADEEMHPCSRSRSARPTTWWCSTRSPRAARSTARWSAARSSVTTPASTCSRSGAAAATSTGRAGASRSWPATRCWPVVLATVAALAEQCGFRLVEDDDTGAVELVPVAG